MNMNPSMCGQNSVFVPTADPCTNCEHLEEELRQAIKDMQDEVDAMQQSIDDAVRTAQDASQDAQDASQAAEDAYEVIEAYPLVGATELSGTWLSLTNGGSPLTPEDGKIYVLLADSTNYIENTLFRWDGSNYVELSENQGGGGSYTSITVTLPVGSWVSNTQTVTATGVTASNIVVVSPTPSSMTEYSLAGIICTTQGADALTFTCDTVPSSAVDVNVLIMD